MPSADYRPEVSSQRDSSLLKVQHGIPMVIGILSIFVRASYSG
jgi:hypothetical protein